VPLAEGGDLQLVSDVNPEDDVASIDLNTTTCQKFIPIF
jgi:hypothetical protein